jgi:hypothetical protein
MMMTYAFSNPHWARSTCAALLMGAVSLVQAQSVPEAPELAEAMTDGSGGTVVYDETKVLYEGEATEGYTLRKGVYLAEVISTGAGGGVKVSWSGVSCPTATETKHYRNLCIAKNVRSTFNVSNPSTQWAGDESVRIILTRLPVNVTDLAPGFEVIEETQKLSEGTSRSYTLNAGSYRADVTSNSRGVSVNWEGTKCATYSESLKYVGTCKVKAGTRVTITNPNAEYKGDETADIVIKKVASETLPRGTVVVDETQSVAENASRTFKFGKGTYQAEISGVTYGVSIAWSRSDCTGSNNAMGGVYRCENLPDGGYLRITNPALPWYKGDENIRILVKKLR